MMFRKMTISLIVALVAILVVAAAVSAQGRWQGAGLNSGGNGGNYARAVEMRRGPQTEAMAGNGLGTQPFMQQRFLNQSGDGTCANFVDEDGDGICDNAGQQL
ncbi:MAG: hypothetical protein KDE19_25060, partial [Caldilineaceae bacterium]|nr:hypothetical protein [Caldilineaceae bacterium]